MPDHALELQHLSKLFGGLHAVENVSMRVEAGERRALIGPNGAGKTTLFNCIAGTMQPSSGRVFLFGKDVTTVPERRRTSLGIGRTYQITNVFHGLTVLENVFLAVEGTSVRKWVIHRQVRTFEKSLGLAETELARVGLERRSSDPVHLLSYGERRQLEFALALASRPRILLLDEPASGLAPGERQRIAEIIADLPRDMTIILIEHDMDVALGLADTVAVLHQGSVLFEGTPAGAQADPAVREVYLGIA